MTYRPNGNSNVDLLTRALWLQSKPMIRGMEPDFDSQHQAVYFRLKEYGYLDDRTVKRALDRLERERLPITEQINRINASIFQMQNGHPHLQPGALNRRVIRIVDPDALVSMHQDLHVDNHQEPWAWNPIADFIDAQEKFLKKNAQYETHCHLGGALPPLWFWLCLMGGDVVFGRFKDSMTGAMKRELIPRWCAGIEGAARLRLQIAAFLDWYYQRYEKLELFPHIAAQQWQNCGAFPQPWSDDEVSWPEGYSATLGKTPIRDLSFELLRTQLPARDWRQDHGFLDPLRPVTQHGAKRPHFAMGERKLLYYLRKLLDRRFEQPWLARLRNDLEIAAECYVVARFSFHRLALHDEGSRGLLRFVQTFAQRGGFFANGKPMRRGSQRNRLRRYTYRMERDRMRLALELHGVQPNHQNPDQVGQEMRVSLGTGTLAPLELRAWAEGALTADFSARENPEPGAATKQNMPVVLTIHTHKDLTSELALNTAKRLHHLLVERPNLRRWITGFDCAGRERDNPPRVFAPAYSYLQRKNREFRPRSFADPGMALQFTYHVGEDYDDLLNALRHIDETSRLLFPKRAGGRLGHALALGEDPETFYRTRATHLEINLGAHILDLVWARGKLQQAGMLDKFIWLENKIANLIHQANPQATLDHGTLANVQRKMWLHEDLDFSYDLQKDPCSEKRLLEMFDVIDVEDRYLPVAVTGPWLQLTQLLQKLLRQQLAQRRIFIEANPSSNLIVASYPDYVDLPYRTIVDDRLALSINTDDPGMFMTTLAGEFVAMYRANLAAGLTAKEATRWLEDRIHDARNSIFLPEQILSFPRGNDAKIEDALDEIFRIG